jgi:Mce-associated membrane protein
MDDAHGSSADPPDSAAAATSSADAMALFEEAEAEAAAAEALAAAAQARVRAARLRREAMAMADTVESYGDAALAAADAQAFEQAEQEYEDEYGEEEYAEDEYGEEYDDYEDHAGEEEDAKDTAAAEPRPRPAWLRWFPSMSIVAKSAAVLVTCGFVGATVYMVLQHDHAAKIAQREAAFAAGAKRSVTYMTSLDYNKAREDVQRVIDSTTGEFKDDFQSRANDFTSVVAQSKSITEGTVNSAAVESVNGNSAVVLVSATSRITNSPPGKNEAPRIWRLRVTVTDVGGQYKMSKVEYVP